MGLTNTLASIQNTGQYSHTLEQRSQAAYTKHSLFVDLIIVQYREFRIL